MTIRQSNRISYRNVAKLVTPVFLLSALAACTITYEKVETFGYDDKGNLIVCGCETSVSVELHDGTTVDAEIDIGVGSVTVRAEGRTAECTPKDPQTLEDLKAKAEACECPEESGDEEGQDDALLGYDGETGGDLERELDGVCSDPEPVTTTCDVTMSKSDWDCKTVADAGGGVAPSP